MRLALKKAVSLSGRMERGAAKSLYSLISASIQVGGKRTSTAMGR